MNPTGRKLYPATLAAPQPVPQALRARARAEARRSAVSEGAHVGEGAAEAVSLGNKCRTVTASDCADLWRDDFEIGWREGLVDREARAALTGKGRVRYRGAAFQPRHERFGECEERRVRVGCGCIGDDGRPQIRRGGGCGVRPLCAFCRRRYSQRLKRRVEEALAAAWKERGGTRDRRDRWRFLTLTAPHSGDVHQDRERLQRAWARLRAWYRKKFERRFVFFGAWELTEGRDGAGHVHLHVIALWPYWIDYADVYAAWQRAVGDARARPKIDLLEGVKGAVNYCLGYALKGVDVGKFADAKFAGRAAAVLYARRTTSTSHGFYVPRIAACGTCHAGFFVTLPNGVTISGVPWHVELPSRLSRWSQARAMLVPRRTAGIEPLFDPIARNRNRQRPAVTKLLRFLSVQLVPCPF